MSVHAALNAGGTTAVRALVYLINLYRHMMSPLRPPSCRFIPTCSHYAVDALTQYGLVRGTWMTVARLAKCGPWHPGGWDPVPERQQDISDAGVRPPSRGESGSFV